MHMEHADYSVGLVQQWAGELTKEYDRQTTTRQWYDDIIRQSVDIGEVESDNVAIRYYLTHLRKKNKMMSVMGTVRSCKFMNGYPDDPDRNRPDLILSVHGIKEGDILNIGSMEYDILGPGPDFTFLHPFNQNASPYSPGSVSSRKNPNASSQISFRAIWIMDNETREKCMRHSDKSYKVAYSNNNTVSFCIYRGQHIPWEYRNFTF